MKKWLKFTIISLSSLFVVLLVAVAVALCTVLSPERLTKVANKQVPHFITCDFSLGKANLTFFRTFPQVGLDIHGLTLLNPMFEAPSDTLLHVNHCMVTINIRKFLRENKIVINKFFLKGGMANLYVDNRGKCNFDIFVTDTSSSGSFDYAVNLHALSTSNVDVRYVDRSSKMMVNVNDIDLKAKGEWDSDICGKIKLNSRSFNFKTLDTNNFQVKFDKMKFQCGGDFSQMDQINGNLSLTLKQLVVNDAIDKYIDSLDVDLKSVVDLSLSKQRLQVKDTYLKFDKYGLQLNGVVDGDVQAGDFDVDLEYSTEKWPIESILAMLPRSIIGNLLDDKHLSGEVGLFGTVKGKYNHEQLPVVSTNVVVKDGSFAMDELPLSFQKINTELQLRIEEQVDLFVNTLDCYTGRNHLVACGVIRDLTDKMLFDVSVTGDFHLADFKTFFPNTLNQCEAEAEATVKACFDYEQLLALAFDKMRAEVQISFSNLDILYNDSIKIQSPAVDLSAKFPICDKPYDIGEWMFVDMHADEIKGGMVGLGDLVAERPHLKVFVSDILDSTASLKLGMDFSMESLTGKMDTIDLYLFKPNGSFVMRDSEKLTLNYSGDAILANVGKKLYAQTGSVDLEASTNYNAKGSNALMRWNPDASVMVRQGKVELLGIDMPVEISQLQADVTTRKLEIKKCSAKIGNTDASISGDIMDMDKYYRGEGLLAGNLILNSNYLDVNQIIDLISGLNAPDSLLEEAPLDSEKDPFMVPYGINLSLQTLIEEALFEDVRIHKIGGEITLKDGTLVLDEMGLTSDAARMQLTALYKSPRKNHLFLGMDFHLLDIKIGELIEMIPAVDTVLPMLKSFAGNAEFHFAIETYLKSNYDPKFSTLRGAAAINGKDLVVLDEQTYGKISRLLRFKKGTTNKIDSLSAEVTIFKNEVDVYPFALSIDKYQAVLSGRHNLDLSYNYNISMLKPIRLGLDIIGSDKRSFKVGKAKYATMFNPERQNVVEQNVLQLKQQINQALKANVKEQPIEQQQ